MNEKFEKFEKISQKTREKIFKTINKLKNELGFDFDVKETPDVITISINDEDTGRKEMSFTKVGDQMMVDETFFDLSDVIEARIRFPNYNVSEAMEKFKNLKK